VAPAACHIMRCLDVVDACRATLMVGFNRRFDPNFAALKARMAAGAIGSLEILSISSRDPSPPPLSYVRRSGGLFRDMMIHDLDMARFMLGEDIASVTAMGGSIVDPKIGAAGDLDTAVVIMQSNSGKVVQINNSRRASYGYDQRVEAHGSKGMIRADNQHETTLEIATETGYSRDKILDFFLERYAAAYERELDAFVGAVTAGRKPSPDGHDGLKASLLADAADESWRTGKRIEL
jgi:myo-inositol 2-dehydrogenase / D-chiro-inositol 1-dehydrogenase